MKPQAPKRQRKRAAKQSSSVVAEPEADVAQGKRARRQERQEGRHDIHWADQSTNTVCARMMDFPAWPPIVSLVKENLPTVRSLQMHQYDSLTGLIYSRFVSSCLQQLNPPRLAPRQCGARSRCLA